MRNFAAYCDMNVSFFETEEQAVAEANSELAELRREAVDGWQEDLADTVCVMKVIHRAKKVNPDADYRVVDYQLCREGDEAEHIDWRIGLKVKPKYKNDRWYGYTGEVVEIMETGSCGLIDSNGVLVVRLQNGETVVSGADRWITV